MARFISVNDYTPLIRTEIQGILLEDYTTSKQYRAEEMAIAQIKQYISGRYDVDLIFEAFDPIPDPDTRNAFIVMITIDCTLYHLYTSTAPDRIPEHRAQRYQDALDWLKSISAGEASADLPPITDDEGSEKGPIRIKSKYKPEGQKW